jgi:predicted DNA-binding protein (MmcQ/YjbR family)
MQDRKEVEDFILSMPNTRLDYPFGEDVAVYKVFIPDKPLSSHVDAMQGSDKQTSEAYLSTANEDVKLAPASERNKPLNSDSFAGDVTEAVRGEWKMFALIPEKKSPPYSISLKCDPQLAVLLREKYESVMEGYHLNKKHWNTILLTGQVPDQEVKDLIVHSYNLVVGLKGHVPEA